MQDTNSANEKSSVAKKRYRSKFNPNSIVEGIIWQPQAIMVNGRTDEHGVTYTYVNAKEPRWIYQYTGRGHTFSCISAGTLIGRLVNATAATDYIGRGEWFEEIIDEPVDVAKLGTTKDLGEEDLKVELWTHFATYWKWPKPQTFNDLKDLWHKVVDVAEEYAANRKKEVPAVRPHSLKGLTARLEEYLSGFGTANTDIHSLAHRLAVIATKFGACRFGPVETPKETPFDVINRTTAKSLGLTELSYGHAKINGTAANVDGRVEPSPITIPEAIDKARGRLNPEDLKPKGWKEFQDDLMVRTMGQAYAASKSLGEFHEAAVSIARVHAHNCVEMAAREFFQTEDNGETPKPAMQVVTGLMAELVEKAFGRYGGRGDLRKVIISIAKQYGRECVDVARAEWMKTDTRKSNARQTEELKRHFTEAITRMFGERNGPEVQNAVALLMDLASKWAGGIAENHASHVLGLYLNKPTALAEVKAIVERDCKALVEAAKKLDDRSAEMAAEAKAFDEEPAMSSLEGAAEASLWADLRMAFGEQIKSSGLLAADRFMEKVIGICRRWTRKEVDIRVEARGLPAMQVVILDTPQNRAAVEEIRKILSADPKAEIPFLTPDINLTGQNLVDYWLNQADEASQAAVDAATQLGMEQEEERAAEASRGKLEPFLDIDAMVEEARDTWASIMTPEEERTIREFHSRAKRKLGLSPTAKS